MNELVPVNAAAGRAGNLPALSAGSLDAYISHVNGIAVLSTEDEQALAREWREQGDLQAAQQLVMSNLRFVVHVARGYLGYGLPLGDLVQEGNIGLMKAVKRFDPDVGVRLVSFAVHWIRAEMHEFILRNWRIVKVATTKAQRKLFFNLRSSKQRLGWLNRAEVETVAEDLGVKPETVLEMESRLSGQDIGFELDSSDDDESRSVAPAAWLTADPASSDPALLVEHADSSSNSEQGLLLALDGLDDRSRAIVERRWLGDSKATLHELADEYGVSAERIRQIEAAAMKKMQKQLSVA